MKKAKQPSSQPEQAHMLCDEGGSHDFRTKKEPSGCDKILCVCCFPCYALCSCSLSDGAALANPFFEQVCCPRSNVASEDKGKAICTKCGLNEAEARDLSDAREIENSRGVRNTGYFSNAMSMPAVGLSNQSPSSPNATSPNHRASQIER